MEIDISEIKDIEQIKDLDAKVLAAAVMYANQGLYVVPIRPNGKALPGKRYNFNYTHASKNPKVVAKWFGPDGKYEGWNVGLGTGRRDGIFVIDLDKHGETNGIESFDNTVPEDFEFRGPVQFTPSGGRHLLFNWREHATSSTSKIADGVDTRGGMPDKCGGHIVVWPSVVEGRAYTWEQGGQTPDTPDWLISKMGKPWKQGARGGNRGNEFVEDDDIENFYSIEEVRGMLEIIDPDELSYDEWLNVGQAIHSQHPDPEGMEIWDQWSQKGERYKAGECSQRWNGFNQHGNIRMGTLIFYAKNRGWDLLNAENPQNSEEYEQIIERLNETFAIVPMGSDVMILEEIDVPEVMRRIQPKYRIFKRQGFRALLENKQMLEVNDQGAVTKKSLADIWLAHENRRTYPCGLGMFPHKPKRYQGYYNMWGGFSVEPQPGNWDLYRGHVRDILCGGDSGLFEWVMDWMANLVQDPANPPGTAIVMNGIEGCGKGTFAHFLGELFGTSYKHITDEEHLVGRFNGHMADCIVAFADEVTYGGNRKVAGKLKALVTERYITAERKGVDAIQYHNCAHLLVASNESWFIPAGPQSRRWLVLELQPDRANDREYFSAIHRQMEQEGGLAGMLHELLEREITSHLGKAPETAALFDQRAQYSSMDSVTGWWSERLATGVLDIPAFRADDESDWPEKITKADALRSYKDWCKDNRRKTIADNVFFKRMLQCGMSLMKFKKPNGKRIPGYLVPAYETCLDIAKRELGLSFQQPTEEDNDGN